jgi:4-amino-4-deoxy-L-arabinose transferase-like glycosyltransferase
MPRAEIERAWVVPALAIVLSITAMRLLLLAFDRTDLFVDETQYWLWGQQFDFGYYSKPPLIAWVIGGVTALAGSDAPFWVRMPGSILHAATALILAALAARIYGSRVALWVAALYMTLPMVSLGSLLISTDTVMAPFFAAALYFHRRLIESGAFRFALLAGAMAGFAFLAKYAGVYFLIGVALAALFFREMRLGLGNVLGLLLAFGLVIAPNVLWNLQNGFATASHTMDNVGWVREASPLAQLNPVGMAEFFFSQFGVFGPILFGPGNCLCSRYLRLPLSLCRRCLTGPMRTGLSRLTSRAPSLPLPRWSGGLGSYGVHWPSM